VRAARGLLRALLAVSMLVSMYLLALTVVLVSLVAVFGPLAAGGDSVTDVRLSSTDASMALPVVFAVVFGVFSVSRSTGTVTGSVRVARAQAPELWEQLVRLAGEVGTRPPTELRLVASANAEVSEEAPMLGLLGGRRCLYLGVPLLMGLSADELSAVLCHELGHYAGRHARLTTVTYRGAVALERTRDRLRLSLTGLSMARLPMSVLYRLLSRYAAGYQRISLAVRRQQEIEADATAALIVGPGVTADALRSVYALTLAWKHFLANYLEPVRREGFLPADLFELFGQLLHDPQYQLLLTELSCAPTPVAPSPRDTHPPLSERLRRLDRPEHRPRRPALAERDSAAAAAPAIGLLGGGAERLLGRVQRQLYATAPAGAVRLSSARWMETTAEIRVEASGQELLRATGRLAQTSVPSLDTLLDVLERDREGELAARIGRTRPGADPGEEAYDRLGSAVLALVGQALVIGGQARWQLSWTGPVRLDTDESLLLHLQQLVRSAVRHPDEVDRLRLALVLAGVDLAVAPGARSSGAARPLPEPDGDAPVEVAAIGRARPTGSSVIERRWAMALGGAILLTVLIVGVAEQNSTVDQTAPVLPPFVPNSILSTPPLLHQPTVWPPTIVRPLPSILSPFFVTVRPGDTLSALAQRYGTTVARLQQLNGLGHSTLIIAGQGLLISV
jgi:Zn-dependent protease with chaperone function